MAIDYQLVVSELREDLESLAEKDGEFTTKACEGLKDTLELRMRHRKYILALNDVLKAITTRYHGRYKPISEKLQSNDF